MKIEELLNKFVSYEDSSYHQVTFSVTTGWHLCQGVLVCLYILLSY